MINKHFEEKFILIMILRVESISCYSQNGSLSETNYQLNSNLSLLCISAKYFKNFKIISFNLGFNSVHERIYCFDYGLQIDFFNRCEITSRLIDLKQIRKSPRYHSNTGETEKFLKIG